MKFRVIVLSGVLFISLASLKVVADDSANSTALAGRLFDATNCLAFETTTPNEDDVLENTCNKPIFAVMCTCSKQGNNPETLNNVCDDSENSKGFECASPGHIILGANAPKERGRTYANLLGASGMAKMMGTTNYGPWKFENRWAACTKATGDSSEMSPCIA